MVFLNYGTDPEWVCSENGQESPLLKPIYVNLIPPPWTPQVLPEVSLDSSLGRGYEVLVSFMSNGKHLDIAKDARDQPSAEEEGEEIAGTKVENTIFEKIAPPQQAQKAIKKAPQARLSPRMATNSTIIHDITNPQIGGFQCTYPGCTAQSFETQVCRSSFLRLYL
jgi:hypothetical protein